jgi:hypothetical protein
VVFGLGTKGFEEREEDEFILEENSERISEHE